MNTGHRVQALSNAAGVATSLIERIDKVWADLDSADARLCVARANEHLKVVRTELEAAAISESPTGRTRT